MSVDNEKEPMVLLPPKEAARRLGIVPSTLRRLAPIYEGIFGELPWEGDAEGGGRLWPSDAVERLQAGRALVAEGRAKSLDSALRALAGGATPPETLARPDTAEEALRLLGSLGGDLRAIRERLEEIPLLRREVEALRAELGNRGAQSAEEISSAPSLRPRAFGDGPPAETAETAPEAPREARADRGDDSGGVLVRLARRLERILGGGRG